SSHGSSRGTRCLTEFTFQVATRTGPTVADRPGPGGGRCSSGPGHRVFAGASPAGRRADAGSAAADLTALARALIEPVPAPRTAGIAVLRAVDGAAEVALDPPPELANVIGSLHSSGLITLVDAAGLAAIVAAGESEDE